MEGCDVLWVTHLMVRTLTLTIKWLNALACSSWLEFSPAGLINFGFSRCKIPSTSFSLKPLT